MIKKSMWAFLAMVGCLSGCAKDRNLLDYQSDLNRAALAAIDERAGIYRGAFVSADRSGGPIGGLTVQVASDEVVAQPNGTTQSTMGAVLKISVWMTGTVSKILTFNNGGYDRAAQQFKATAAVTGRGNAELAGTFDGDTLTGTLEADGYPDRGGTFVLTRNAPAPTFAGLRTRVAVEDQFLFNYFSAIGKFTMPSPNPQDDRVSMSILRQVSVDEQNLMDVITPYRYVDVSLTLPGQRGVIFAGSIWDINGQTLKGTYSAPGGSGLSPTELQLSCTQSPTGWNCQVSSLINSVGLVFSADFVPAPGATQ